MELATILYTSKEVMQQLAGQANTSTKKKYYPAIRQDAHAYAGRILKDITAV